MKVYIIVGLLYGDEIESEVSDYGVVSTYEKAQHELELITKEIKRDCKRDNITIIKEQIDIENGQIRFVFENDNEEIYTIYERIVDYIDKEEEI